MRATRAVETSRAPDAIGTSRPPDAQLRHDSHIPLALPEGVVARGSVAPIAAPAPSPSALDSLPPSEPDAPAPSEPELALSEPEPEPLERADAASAPSLDFDALASGRTSRSDAPDAPPEDDESNEHEPLADPRADARRARSRRLAHVAIVLSSLLCVLALGRALLTWETGADIPRPPPSPALVPTATATVATTPFVIPIVPSATAGRPEQEAPTLDREAARAERFEAQAALEIGDVRRAASVAERAVEHDPTEADGWLLLVAARLDLHDEEGAHRALTSCADHAVHGPRGECMALMQPNGP